MPSYSDLHNVISNHRLWDEKRGRKSQRQSATKVFPPLKIQLMCLKSGKNTVN